MELRSPVTLDEYRARYARSSSAELAEEAGRRGLDTSVAPVSTAVETAPTRQYIYSKAPIGERFGAYVIDSIIGIGPVITAAIFDFLFHIAQSPMNRTINMIATVTWAIYYGATKDARGNGQSVGKKLFGLMVVGTDTNRPCTIGQSTGRAFVRFLFSGVPLVGQLVEPIAVLAADDGRRIGDRAAKTQVIRASDYTPRDVGVVETRGGTVPPP
jgi:uncharacterized RDD family membrane protein YckC